VPTRERLTTGMPASLRRKVWLQRSRKARPPSTPQAHPFNHNTPLKSRAAHQKLDTGVNPLTTGLPDISHFPNITSKPLATGTSKVDPENTGKSPALSLQDYIHLPTFARRVLELPLYPKQAAVLADLDRPGSEVTAVTANGVGKTTMLAAPVVIWHALCYPKSVTVTSSGVFRQVKEQMWPRIRELARRFSFLGIDPSTTEFTVPHGYNGCHASKVIGFSTDDPGKFEGWHSDTSLLIVLDECKTIPEEIYQATERCKQGQPTRILLLSSAGDSKGFFYRSHTSERHLWKAHKITADDCPHIDKALVAKLVAKWGREHPLVKSQVFAEFMPVGSDRHIIPEATYDHCLANKPIKKGTDRAAFCDFAAGGDENVFALREGNQVIQEALTAWRDSNTMASVGRFLQLFRRYNLTPTEVSADAGGLGIPMCDALAEAGFPVHRVNNGLPAYSEREFANRGAEIWFTAARMIEKCDIALPHDDLLRAQCTDRRVKTDSKGRLGCESKPELRSRGKDSPDRADAVLGAIASRGNSDILTQFSRRPMLEMLSVLQSDEGCAGYNAGW
jgi:phage terminase large subunit